MKSRFPLPLRAWMIAPACACAVLVTIAVLRISHLDFLAGAAGATVAMKEGSPTGFAGGVRQFVPATRDSGSFETIAQTEQMLRTGNWRVRHVDYDNAPGGRDNVSASPYRWWLATVAFVHSTLTGDPVEASVERAALYADPLLHLILVAGTAFYVARRFGVLASALATLGLATMFPFAGTFMPGQPRNDVLAVIAAVWSILPLLTISPGAQTADRLNRKFLNAGMIGGFALWIEPRAMVAVIAGIAISGVAISFFTRNAATAGVDGSSLPWRRWALGGAAACLVAFSVEFLPGNAPDFRLDVISPLHGIAWLGIGELLARADAWIRRTRPVRAMREALPVLLAIAAIAGPLVFAYRTRESLFGPDPALLRLSPLSESLVGSGLFSLISREGVSVAVIAALVPLLVVVPLVWLVARKSASVANRAAALVALGPIAAIAPVAALHLGRWILLDATLLAGLIACAAPAAATGFRSGWAASLAGGTLLASLLGVVAIWPQGASSAVSETELASLIERDLAHWLSVRTGSGPTTVLASPNLSASLAFSGGFRSLGSPYRENRAAFEVSLRIAGTSSQDEAYALVQKRGITHVVLASWDPSLEELARLGDKDGKSLAALLHNWLSPRWLRPVAYPVPQVPGIEPPSVLVFEVVELQDNSVALSSLAEYFVESGNAPLASQAAGALGRMFPNDLGAQVARARASIALGDMASATEAFDEVQRQLTSGGTHVIPWDRRVSLAILLSDAKSFEQARAQTEKCLAEITEPRLRALSPLSLERFAFLMKTLGLKPADAHLTQLVRDLLPPEHRADF